MNGVSLLGGLLLEHDVGLRKLLVLLAEGRAFELQIPEPVLAVLDELDILEDHLVEALYFLGEGFDSPVVVGAVLHRLDILGLVLPQLPPQLLEVVILGLFEGGEPLDFLRKQGDLNLIVALEPPDSLDLLPGLVLVGAERGDELVLFLELGAELHLHLRDLLFQVVDLLLTLLLVLPEGLGLPLLEVQLGNIVVLYLPEALLQSLIAALYFENGKFETVLDTPEALSFQTHLVLQLVNSHLQG